MWPPPRSIRQLLPTIVAVSVLSAWGASAQPSSASEDEAAKSAARDRYEQGVTAYRDQRYEEAIEMFRAANRLAPRAALSYNIARAYEELEKPARALQYYREYLRRGPSADNASAVEARISELEGVLMDQGVQQLRLSSDPSGATLVIDGRRVGKTPWTGELAPGFHELMLTRSGRVSVHHGVKLEADRAKDVHLQLAALTSSTRRPAGPPEQSRGGRDRGRDDSDKTRLGAWPVVTLSAGAASLLAAGGVELLRRNAEDEVRSAENQVVYVDNYDAMERRKTTARVLAGVGGALVLGSGALFLANGKREDSSRDTAGLWCGVDQCVGTYVRRFR